MVLSWKVPHVDLYCFLHLIDFQFYYRSSHVAFFTRVFIFHTHFYFSHISRHLTDFASYFILLLGNVWHQLRRLRSL